MKVPTLHPRRLRPSDDAFPERLSRCSPAVDDLWVLGADPGTLEPMVAVVGSRKASAYGLEMAHGLARQLTAEGFAIISGMALGIDTAAHTGALDAGGATIAVLGSGLARPYPATNKPLMERIARRGAVVSEFALDQGAHKRFFTHRNRIIAALAVGVVVVQAAHPKAGGLSTASWAGDLNVPVFAVPGDIGSDLSWGPHQLLREGAHVCTCADDVLSILQPELERAREGRGITLPADLSADERAVAEELLRGPVGPDAVARSTGLDIGAVVRALTGLELAGAALRIGGGRYRLRGGP